MMRLSALMPATIDITRAYSPGASGTTPDAPSTNVEVGSLEWLKRVRAALKQLQPPISAEERALAELAEDIRLRREAKCSTKDIAALLTMNGLQIDGPALTRHLRGASKNNGKTR